MGYPQPFGLVMMSEEARALAASQEGRARLDRSYEALLHQVNASLDQHEALGFLAVVKDEWAIENGFVTPTMKIKRAAIEESYQPSFDAWNDAGQAVVWQ